MEQALKDSINKMIVNGNRLELPKEQLANYAQVKRVLQKAGGKYIKLGFTFLEPAEDIKSRLVGGEVIDDKKKFQFFETPPELAERMLELLEIREAHKLLEPSAGNGALISGELSEYYYVTAIEINPKHIDNLISLGCNVIEGDFLNQTEKTLGGKFDRIIANPPFTKNQDIDHIMHMYELLEDGGRIVTLSSMSWTFGSQKKQVAFREFLNEVGATTEELPEGNFKESGTNISTMLIVIDK